MHWTRLQQLHWELQSADSLQVLAAAPGEPRWPLGDGFLVPLSPESSHWGVRWNSNFEGGGGRVDPVEDTDFCLGTGRTVQFP